MLCLYSLKCKPRFTYSCLDITYDTYTGTYTEHLSSQYIRHTYSKIKVSVTYFNTIYPIFDLRKISGVITYLG